ncbi:MAG: glycosyltransferase family 2 protein [Alicyclobacillaceae bacterium]|nr:glycosyltransferase family 2 protein [Alicyclobacillaceae bacterium]
MGETCVDIVVVSFNTCRLLLDCLKRIHRYTPTAHRIVVVDNGSQDASVSAVRSLCWPNLDVLVNAHNCGYAAACNQGIRASSSPFILLLNSDVRVTRHWLEPLIACMESDKRIAVVGPKLVDGHGRINGAGIVGTLESHEPRGWLEPNMPGKYDKPEDCLSVCGAAYLIRRALLDDIGYFDENYFFYFEETDYSVRAWQKGYRVVYCPDSILIHIGGGSSQNHPQLRAWFEESQRYFRSKWLEGRDGTNGNHPLSAKFPNLSRGEEGHGTRSKGPREQAHSHDASEK